MRRTRTLAGIGIAAAALVILGLIIGPGKSRWIALALGGLTAAGLVFAAAVVRTGRLGSAIAVHIGFNATTFAALVLL